MKILHVCNRFHPAFGGVETHVLNLALQALQNGDQVEVACSDYISVLSRERFKKGQREGTYKGIRFKRFRGLRIGTIDATTIIPGLPRFLVRHAKDYDIVHVHSYGYFCSWGSIVVCYLLGKEVIFTPHYAQETTLPSIVKIVFDKMFGGWTFRLAKTVIALTRTEKQNISQTFGVPKSQITIIPNGINISEIVKKGRSPEKNRLFRQHGINSANKSIIVVARLAKNKGHIFLLEAYSSLAKEHPYNLIIVGKDWGMEQSIRRFIAEHQLVDAHVLTTVDDEEKLKFLAYVDVLALPSIGGEAFGIVLLEAMSQGTPVVASDVGGISDLIVSGKNGYLVAPGNSEDLAQRLRQILHDENAEYSTFCVKFSKTYDWGRISKKLLGVYLDA